ncbi:MAG: transposase family protein, partial [Verrucomicrobia bacterium]|nr:transposase family protein [Verrucomicrobiota bacterium]
AERALKAADVLHWLQKAVAEHGAPEYLRSDNGSEFIAKIVQRWLKENRVKTIYIEPGSPWQNGFVESFHGRFRDECLNREQLWTLTGSAGGGGRLPAEIQSGEAAQRAGLRKPGGLRREFVHAPLRSGYALPPRGMDKESRKT